MYSDSCPVGRFWGKLLFPALFGLHGVTNHFLLAFSASIVPAQGSDGRCCDPSPCQKTSPSPWVNLLPQVHGSDPAVSALCKRRSLVCKGSSDLQQHLCPAQSSKHEGQEHTWLGQLLTSCLSHFLPVLDAQHPAGEGIPEKAGESPSHH